MRFLLKICVLSIVIAMCTMDEQQCLSSNRNVGKCQDWKNMSVLVADLVGQSMIDEKVETKSSMLTLLVRAASGVIGRGAGVLKTLVVNGLVLLTQTILTVTDIQNTHRVSVRRNSKIVPGSRPIDWILNNPFIKSMVDDAIDESLPDQLEDLASGMPCVQLLVCRLSPIMRNMQRRIKEDRLGPSKIPLWRVSEWWQIKGTAKYCTERHSNCANTVKSNYLS